MKKAICALLAIFLALVFCACSDLGEGVSMTAVVIDISAQTALVEPVENDAALASSDRISFSTAGLENINVQVGDTVRVTYGGEIMESYPAQIRATGWSVIKKALP